MGGGEADLFQDGGAYFISREKLGRGYSGRLQKDKEEKKTGRYSNYEFIQRTWYNIKIAHSINAVQEAWT